MRLLAPLVRTQTVAALGPPQTQLNVHVWAQRGWAGTCVSGSSWVLVTADPGWAVASVLPGCALCPPPTLPQAFCTLLL